MDSRRPVNCYVMRLGQMSVSIGEEREMAKYDHIKHAVLSKILAGNSWQPNGRAKFKAKGKVIHVCYCGTNAAGNSKYKFNINPNTLSANYEVWICGDAKQYYLIPKAVIERIYTDSEGYIDRRYSGIRVVSVDASSDTATYAKGGKNLDLRAYFGGTLL
jgi:hypothetical protein